MTSTLASILILAFVQVIVPAESITTIVGNNNTSRPFPVSNSTNAAPVNGSAFHLSTAHQNTITTPPLQLSTPVSCSQCQVVQSNDGLARVYWCPSTLHLTLDTISIVVTQYNNTRLTNTATKYGNVSTMNILTIAEASSLVYYYKVLGQYPARSLSMVNGIDGKVGTTSFEWPQPYLAIDAFWYKTANPNSFCPQGAYAKSAGDSCLCVFDNDVNALIVPDYKHDQLSETTYPIHTTLYQKLKAAAIQPNMENRMEDDFFHFNNISFSAWLISNTGLNTLLPDLRSCTFLPLAMGPPVIKIPVNALTTTTTTTSRNFGYYSHSNTPRPVIAPTKTEAPQTFHSPDSPDPTITVSTAEIYEPIPLSPNPSARAPQTGSPQGGSSRVENVPNGINQQGTLPSENSQGGSNEAQNGQVGENPSNTDYNQNSSVEKGRTSKIHGGNHDGVSHDSNDDNKTYRPSVTPKFEIPQSVSDLPVITPAPGQSAVFTFAGSTYTASPSNIVVAGQILKPGGPGIVVSGTSISLDAAGNYLIVGSETQLLPFPIRATPAPRASPVITIDGSRYTANDVSQYLVNGQTLAPGGVIIVASKSVSLDSGGSILVVGSSSVVLGGPAPTPAPPQLTYAGSIYTANPFGDFVVAGQTLTPGGEITVSGTGISLSPDGTIAVIGGSTQLVHPAAVTDTPTLTLGGTKIIANNAGQFLIAGQTLTLGGDITVSGTHILLSPNGIVTIDKSRSQFLTPFHVTKKLVLTFGGSIYTADGFSRFVVDGQTLSQGGGISVHGTSISIPSGGSYFIIGSSIQDFSTATIPLVEAPAITFAGSTYTEKSASEFVIDGLTLTKGGVITVQGSRISFDPNGSNVVIGTSTQKIFIDSITGPAAPVITFGGSIYLENSASDFVIDGQTLSKGGVITVDGTTVSFPTTGTAVIVMENGTSTETVGLGALIMNGFNGPSMPTTTTTAAGGGGSVSASIFTGEGHSNRMFTWTLLLLAILFLLILDMSVKLE